MSGRLQHPFHLQWAIRLGAPVIGIDMTPNGSLIAAGAVDRAVYRLDIGGNEIWRREVDYEVWTVAVPTSGRYVAAGTAQKNPIRGSLYIFDANGEKVFEHSIGAPVWDAAFSNQGRELLCSCWNGCVYKFALSEGKWILNFVRELGKAGIYGVGFGTPSKHGVAVVYGEGLVSLSASGEVVSRLKLAEAGYRLQMSREDNLGIVGLRDGSVAIFELHPNGELRERQRIHGVAHSPIYGVSLAPSGKVFVAGGFDGNVYVGLQDGRLVWRTQTDGEFWDLAATQNCSYIAAASGNGFVYLWRNEVTADAATEIGEAESDAWSFMEHNETPELSPLLNVYERHGLIEYGYKNVLERSSTLQHENKKIARNTIKKYLERVVNQFLFHAQAHYLLASIYEEEGEAWLSALHYMRAAAEPNLQLLSFVKAGENFIKANHPAAGMSCFRRTRQQVMQDLHKKVLYELARSFEDTGGWDAARVHYDVLLTWDPFYRDVAYRLTKIDESQSKNIPIGKHDRDYTGLTVNLLGQAVLRTPDVDPLLLPVVQARGLELKVSEVERDALVKAFNRYSRLRIDSSREDQGNVTYNTTSYVKYDYLIPEDELKKELEMINFISFIDIKTTKKSLDIGAATGRYPSFLTRNGVEAFGIDISFEAMKYAASKKSENANPIYLVGDGKTLPFDSMTFDLVTCMMGTISHLTPNNQIELVGEAFRVLAKSGVFIISTWDLECEHLSFLSMYSQHDKEMISRNTISITAMKQVFKKNGFSHVSARPVGMIPDVFSYELGADQSSEQALRHMMEIDLGVRSRAPSAHGQMYMVFGLKE